MNLLLTICLRKKFLDWEQGEGHNDWLESGRCHFFILLLLVATDEFVGC